MLLSLATLFLCRSYKGATQPSTPSEFQAIVITVYLVALPQVPCAPNGVTESSAPLEVQVLVINACFAALVEVVVHSAWSTAPPTPSEFQAQSYHSCCPCCACHALRVESKPSTGDDDTIRVSGHDAIAVVGLVAVAMNSEWSHRANDTIRVSDFVVITACQVGRAAVASHSEWSHRAADTIRS
eukprot:4894629-Amphidinium_carterae.1